MMWRYVPYGEFFDFYGLKTVSKHKSKRNN